MRGEYWDEIRDIGVEDFVLIDESGVNLGLMRLFAWALQDRRAYGEQPKRGKSRSGVAGLSLAGVVASVVIVGAFDSLRFEAFVVTRLVPKLWAGACVGMDKCSVHKGDTMREQIEAVGARLVYLPPYSPDFLPIENFWSTLQSILKTLGARAYPALSEALEPGFETISQAGIKSWFTHCCYCAS